MPKCSMLRAPVKALRAALPTALKLLGAWMLFLCEGVCLGPLKEVCEILSGEQKSKQCSSYNSEPCTLMLKKEG